MIFKVDFEKAYDSFSEDYLLEMMQIMGFGPIWCGWILEMLRSSRVSVLVNCSPTVELQMIRGLRQGDPLFPFLFILAMEGFHVALVRAQLANAFRGISVSGMEISPLFYADDAVLLINWDLKNTNMIVCIMCCFFLTSGLKISLLKSKLIGVGVLFS